MSETVPTKFPEWASVPAVDPISGQPNIVEPSEAKKDSGWNFKERPPRQDFNWWMNLVWKWIKWFHQETIPSRYIKGFNMYSTNDEDVIISPGICRFGIFSSTWTKNILDSNAWVDWAEGNSAGLVPNDLSAISGDTWLYIFAISDDLYTKFDFAVDTSLNASTILGNSVISTAGYTQAKRIGAIAVRDAGGVGSYKVVPFKKTDNLFTYLIFSGKTFDFWQSITGVSITNSWNTVFLALDNTSSIADMPSVPPLVDVISLMTWVSSSTDRYYLRPVPVGSTGHSIAAEVASLTNYAKDIQILCIGAQVEAKLVTSAGPVSLTYRTHGYIDPLNDVEYHV